MEGRLWALGWIGLILLLTLLPGSVTSGSPQDLPSTFCLVCGGRGVADAMVNVLLFLPLGFAAASAMGGRLRAVALALALSLTIEMLQEVIPGRHPAAGDVIYNTLGGAAGVGVAALWNHLVRPTRPVAVGLTLGAGVAASALLLLTGALLAPSATAVPSNAHLAQLQYMEAYEGQVLEASLGPVRLASETALDPELAGDLVRSGAPLRARVVVGPDPSHLATIVSILDESASEILLLGAEGPDLVLRLRYEADDLRLDRPDLRVRSAFEAHCAGDTVSLRAERTAEGYSVWVDQREYRRLGHTPGQGWGLLLHPGRRAQWVDRALDIVWVAGLLSLVGWWAPGPGWAAGALSIALAGMVAGAVTGPLVDVAPGEVLAAIGGVVLGSVLRRSLQGGRPAPARYASVEHTKIEGQGPVLMTGAQSGILDC